MLEQTLTLPNGTVLKNRIAKSAMEEDLAHLGAPSERHVELYRRWGEGGAGLLITGNVTIDRRAPTDPGIVVIEDDDHLQTLSRWAQAAKAHGSVVLMQINHPGRQIPKYLAREPVAPSPVGVEIPGARGMFKAPRALTEADIRDLIARFARAAEVAVKAGFDGVQLHAAHGYLVNQFLSPLTNRRSDAWGGTLENRARFLIEVLRAMRAVVPADKVLSIKLNSADFQRGGFDEDAARWVIERLNDEGVDLLELSGGNYESPAMLGVRSSTAEREAYFLDFAQSARALARMPIMVTGGFRSRAGMEAALASGAIDLAGLAKPFCVEPDLPRNLLAGTIERIDWPARRLRMQALDSLATMGWARAQIQRMGAGKRPDLRMGTVRNLLRDLVVTRWHAWHYRRWLRTGATEGTAHAG